MLLSYEALFYGVMGYFGGYARPSVQTSIKFVIMTYWKQMEELNSAKLW